MAKTYKASETRQAALPRSKRLRESGASTGGSFSVVLTGGTGSGDGSALTQDVEADVAVGHITEGQILQTGMTFTEFVRALLTKTTTATLTGKLSTGNDVEYGTDKGAITYTSNRNSSGKMLAAYMDEDPTLTLEFSEEVNGAQTAVRTLEGKYTQSETYLLTAKYEEGERDIEAVTLTNKITANVRRKWFAGVVSAVPTTSAEVRALGGSGLYTKGGFSFAVGQWKMVAVCIPEGSITDISVTAYPGNFIQDTGVCSGPTTISVEGANGSAAVSYKMWIIKAETTNDADTFSIKTE